MSLTKGHIPFKLQLIVITDSPKTRQKRRTENDIETGHDAKGCHGDNQSLGGFHFHFTEFFPFPVNEHWRDNGAGLIVCNDVVCRCRLCDSGFA